jgi:hypothetical protein
MHIDEASIDGISAYLVAKRTGKKKRAAAKAVAREGHAMD